jgi:hypothetical protein
MYHVYCRVARGEFVFDNDFEAIEFRETLCEIRDLDRWSILKRCQARHTAIIEDQHRPSEKVQACTALSTAPPGGWRAGKGAWHAILAPSGAGRSCRRRAGAHRDEPIRPSSPAESVSY